MPDLFEAGGIDSDQDGIVDSLVDSDNDGLSDIHDPDSGGTPLPIPDSDGDQIPDFLDSDSDGDGISDRIEAQDIFSFEFPRGVDSDGDGIDDAYDRDASGTPPRVLDVDGDSVPDFIDIDSDGDGTGDLQEGFDFDGDGQPDVVPLGRDLNRDGLDDAFSGYDRPNTIRTAWREVAASLFCSEVSLISQLETIRSTNAAIAKRAELFAAKAPACGREIGIKQLISARSRSRTLSRDLTSYYGGQLYQCPPGYCTTRIMRVTKRRLGTIARGLAARQKRIKLGAIQACGTKPHPPGHVDRRKNTADYLRILLRAIGKLPDSITRCP